MTVEITPEESEAIVNLINKSNWPGSTSEAVTLLKSKFTPKPEEPKQE